MNTDVSTPKPRPSRFWTYVVAGIVGLTIALLIQQCAERNASSTDQHRIEWPTPPTGAKPNK